MNAGGNPELVFEQTGKTRHIVNNDHYKIILQEAPP
jgi:hypothetical protein